MGLFSKNKQISGDGTCLWIDNVGAPTARVFKIFNKHDSQNEIVLDFGNNETYSADRKFIRGKRVVIYKTSSDKIVIQDPNKWADINLAEYGIKELRFNLQNFGIQEGKAALHRWTMPKSTMDKLLPLFKLLFVCIAIAVIGWGMLKGATYLLDIITRSRIIDCAALVTNQPVPIGAVNNTIPIGA